MAGAIQQRPKTTSSTALAIMAQRLAVEPAELERTLMETAFKGATPAEFIALAVVANTYNLNPLVREIYAFPKKGGGIVPLVPIDGWLKLIRTDPDFAGMDIHWSDELMTVGNSKECPAWVEVTIHHKSHPEHPTVHREWLDETYRNTGPWNENTKRMLEWKGINQAGRVAFGLSGIVDQDEAERIDAMTPAEGASVEVVPNIGAKDYKKLVKAAERFGYTEEDLLATAATAGHEGDGPSIPEDLAQRLFAGMKANPRTAPEAPAQAEPEAPPADEPQAGYRTPLMGDE